MLRRSFWERRRDEQSAWHHSGALGLNALPGQTASSHRGKAIAPARLGRCRRAKKLNHLIIATDDFRIAEAAFTWGAEVAMTSADHLSGTDRIAEVAAKTKQFAHIINIQGDEPMIDPKLIDRLVRALQRDRKLEMITAAHPFADPRDAESPHQVKVVVNAKNEALSFSRVPIPAARLLRHQGIYGYRRDLLLRFVRWKISPLERAESLEQLRALENGVRIKVVMTESGSPGVDTPEDARRMERLMISEGKRSSGRQRRKQR